MVYSAWRHRRFNFSFAIWIRVNHFLEIGGGIGYWRKRFLAVFIPYTIFEIVTHWFFTDFDLLDFVLDITCIKPLYGNGWYLQYLLGWYIVFWIVMKVPLLQKHKLVILLVVSVVVFFTSYELAAEQALSFLTGVAIAEYKDREWLKKYLNYTTAFSLLLIGTLALAFKQLDFVRNSHELCMKTVQLLIKLPIGLFVVYATCSIGQKISLNGLAYLGAVSYELYLVHGVILKIVDVSVMGAVSFAIVSAMATVLFWILYDRFIEIQIKRLLKVG